MNEIFIKNMQAILGDEAEDFFNALSTKSKVSGLRANLLKTQVVSVTNHLNLPLDPVPWCDTGIYYPADIIDRPSKNPLYHAGLYYLQEPSAMSAAALLDAKPGDAVLDLCAAPGGKSSQIAGQLGGRGVLVSNDASATRSKALVKNLTLCGVTNAVILNEMPARLATKFEEFFDKILVDAPCSGEGMFRKDPDAAKAWTENKPEECVKLQREILHYAAAMLKPGGRLVYSTCTFNRQENEEMMIHFLQNRPDFKIVPIEHARYGFSPGLPPLTQAARIWPHVQKGEGHFLCLLEKVKVVGSAHTRKLLKNLDQNFKFDLFYEFCAEHLDTEIEGNLLHHNGAVFVVPDGMPDLKGLRIARSGWYLGEIKKGRFEPSHALALGLRCEDVKVRLDLDAQQCLRYLKGESFEVDLQARDGGKPWVLCLVSGHPIGWARLVNGRLKNKFPHVVN